MARVMLYSFALLFCLCGIAASRTIVKTLPDFPGPLPFTLETGYVGVRSETVQLFYYFIESENDPATDPLVLWLAGGVRCSGLFPLMYEVGPIAFDLSVSNESYQSIIPSPNSWTKFANVIFLDVPAGTGFSYSTTQEAWLSNDTTTLRDNYEFIRKWLLLHPKFLKNPFYVAGETYTGTAVPLLAYAITQGNKNGTLPVFNFQGYILGNPLADLNKILNARIPYSNRFGLISDEYYQAALLSCDGEYVNVNSSNAACTQALARIDECTDNINLAQILEPNCPVDQANPTGIKWEWEHANSIRILLPSQLYGEEEHCRVTGYYASRGWANKPSVQKALHVRPGAIREWRRCNRSSGFTVDVTNAIDYHRLLAKEPLRVFIYSGDHDMSVPFISTIDWIKSLKLNLVEDWRPWNVEGQIAGYTQRYEDGKYSLTYATVKGGGHPSAEYRPKEVFAAGKAWLSFKPL